jgi:hypothetical protein
VVIILYIIHSFLLFNALCVCVLSVLNGAYSIVVIRSHCTHNQSKGVCVCVCVCDSASLFLFSLCCDTHHFITLI